jgi:hypothetical protein
MDTIPIRGKRATAQGLNPATCSVFDVCCHERGIDPKSSSFLDLAASRMGKAPGSISIAGAEREFGKQWTSTVCK